MHVHVSALHGLIVAAYVVLFFFLKRLAETYFPESKIAAALGSLFD